MFVHAATRAVIAEHDQPRAPHHASAAPMMDCAVHMQTQQAAQLFSACLHACLPAAAAVAGAAATAAPAATDATYDPALA